MSVYQRQFNFLADWYLGRLEANSSGILDREVDARQPSLSIDFN